MATLELSTLSPQEISIALEENKEEAIGTTYTQTLIEFHQFNQSTGLFHIHVLTVSIE